MAWKKEISYRNDGSYCWMVVKISGTVLLLLFSVLLSVVHNFPVNFFSELDNIDLYQWAMIKEFDGRVLNIWVGSKNLDVEMLDPPVGWLSRFQERRYYFYPLYSSS